MPQERLHYAALLDAIRLNRQKALFTSPKPSGIQRAKNQICNHIRGKRKQQTDTGSGKPLPSVSPGDCLPLDIEGIEACSNHVAPTQNTGDRVCHTDQRVICGPGRDKGNCSIANKISNARKRAAVQLPQLASTVGIEPRVERPADRNSAEDKQNPCRQKHEIASSICAEGKRSVPRYSSHTLHGGVAQLQ
jgi:hypothetical protein